MSDRSAIEWTDASWNPLRARRKATFKNDPGGEVGWYCEHVSEGCRNCYAETFNRRLGTTLDYKPAHRGQIDLFLDEKTMLQPLHWKRPRKIFVGSMTDFFGDWVTDSQLDRIFAVMARTPWHTYQVLTKRAERMRDWMTDPDTGDGHINTYHRVLDVAEHMIEGEQLASFVAPSWPLPNVWLGVSAEDQPTYDERWPHLANTPCARAFISYEPALGPLNLQSTALVLDRPARMFPDWVISGGESGPHARPANPQWFRSIRDQCSLTGISYFHKQNGEFASVSEVEGSGAHHHFDDGRTVRRVGKKRAGRLLDGVEHNEFPKVQR